MEAEAQSLGTADSMEAAAAVLARQPDPASRLTDEQLKRAKAAGCPAFRGSRVYLDELLVWWEENEANLPTGDAEHDAINREIAREKLRKVRFENDAKEGKYIEKEAWAARVLALGLELKSILRRKLEEEFPDRQANRSREEILGINRGLVDELCKKFQEEAAKWSSIR